MNYTHYTRDCPDDPRAGDHRYHLWFPLKGGGKVHVFVGEAGFQNLLCVLRMYEADAAEGKEFAGDAESR